MLHAAAAGGAPGGVAVGGPILAALTQQRHEEARKLGLRLGEPSSSSSSASASASASSSSASKASSSLSPASMLHPPSPQKHQVPAGAFSIPAVSSRASSHAVSSTSRTQRSSSITAGKPSGISQALRRQEQTTHHAGASAYASATPAARRGSAALPWASGPSARSNTPVSRARPSGAFSGSSSGGATTFGLRASKQFPSCPDLASLATHHHEQEVRSHLPVSELSLSDAKTDLYAARQTGWLHKKGFRWFKQWKSRWVVLHGRNLSYFDSRESMMEGKPPRGSLELNHHFLILPSNEDGKRFAFKIVPVAAPDVSAAGAGAFDAKAMPSPSSSSHSGTRTVPSPLTPRSPYRPNIQYAELVDDVHLDDAVAWTTTTAAATAGGTYAGGDPSRTARGGGGGAYAPVTAPIAQADGDIWYFAAESQEERDAWVGFFKRSLDLIRRCDDTRPTLSGMGTIHDHYIIGRVLGVGRFGVVREGANKHSKQLCAIKIINKKKHLSTAVAEKTVRNEIKLMRVIARVAGVRRHHGLVSLHECYEDDFLIYIVMDSVRGGDLLDNLIDMKWKRRRGFGVQQQPRMVGDTKRNAMPTAEERRVERYQSMYTEKDVGSILKQILEAVAALHEVGVIHRDIKPENILYEDSLQNDDNDGDDEVVDAAAAADDEARSAAAEQDALALAEVALASAKNASAAPGAAGAAENAATNANASLNASSSAPQLKIADFSLAGTVRQFAREALATGKKTIVGTPGYIAPEVLMTGEYSTASDMYAIGVCLYTILAGYPPIAGGSDADVFQRTKDGLWGFEKMDWENITPEARDLTWQLLSVDPARRPQASKALEHPWFDFDDLRCNVPLVGARSRLRQFNSKRKLRVAAFAKLLSSRKTAMRRLSHGQKVGGGIRRNLSNGGLKAMVRGMVPSPSCPDLKAMTRADSGNNLSGLAGRAASNLGFGAAGAGGVGGMGEKHDPYVGTQTIHRAQGPMGRGGGGGGGSSGERTASGGIGSGFTGMRRSDGGAAGGSLSRMSGGSGGSGGLGGMRRSHTTGQNLANLAHFDIQGNRAGAITGNFRSAEKNQATTLASISESIDERGSFASNGSLPRFTPGSLSMFSDADMRRIGMNRPQSRSSSRSGSTTQRDGGVGEEEAEVKEGGGGGDKEGYAEGDAATVVVCLGLDEDTSDLMDSPLGF